LLIPPSDLSLCQQRFFSPFSLAHVNYFVGGSTVTCVSPFWVLTSNIALDTMIFHSAKTDSELLKRIE